MDTRSWHIRPKILCIDDDSAITAALKLRLLTFDVDVFTAADGTEGMWLALNEKPDVIITDLGMPSASGDEMLECLKGRADMSETPVIALTGKRDCDLKRWMLTLGVEHYLHKPLRFGRVLDALQQYIELRPRLDQRLEGNGACEAAERTEPHDSIGEYRMAGDVPPRRVTEIGKCPTIAAQKLM